MAKPKPDAAKTKNPLPVVKCNHLCRRRPPLARPKPQLVGRLATAGPVPDGNQSRRRSPGVVWSLSPFLGARFIRFLCQIFFFPRTLFEVPPQPFSKCYPSGLCLGVHTKLQQNTASCGLEVRPRAASVVCLWALFTPPRFPVPLVPALATHSPCP